MLSPVLGTGDGERVGSVPVKMGLHLTSEWFTVLALNTDKGYPVGCGAWEIT